MSKKVLIVGGVAAGASLAARLRRLDESARIVMLEKDEYISFANCGMPYYIGGAIEERSKLLIQTPQSMRARFNIDVRTNSEAVFADTRSKLVRVKSKTGEYDESYDILALCVGCEPIMLNADDAARDKVFTLRSMADVDRIKSRLELSAAKSAVVIGGGFVGVEMAENLTECGLEVTLVEAFEQILPPFDVEMARLVENELKENGVKLTLGAGVERIKDDGGHICVSLANGASVSADIAICAVGVRPATAFLKGSGIALGARGHIAVDEHMQTSVQDVYAAGDAAQITDFVTSKETAVPLAGPANKQGRIAADNIAGIASKYAGAQGTAIIKAFSVCAALTGKNERDLKKEGIPYHAVYTHPFSHATYYPNEKRMAAKLVFGSDGKILGCQMVGSDGVDKRIDVIATAMRLGAHVTKLAELELAYAPPYSSAKDPVNMLGYIAENVLGGVTDLITPLEAINRDKDNTILLDVRTRREYEAGHIEGAVNIPLDELRERLIELDKEKAIYEYCQVGIRSHAAHRILKQNGFKVSSVTGGYLSLVGV